jgi:long-chain acyl-CoA synthetase
VVSALATLLSGGTLYLLDSYLPSGAAGLIERERLTGFPGVPFMFQLLNERSDRHDLASLRFVLSAGSPLPLATARSFEASRGVRVHQLYGSTETGVVSTTAADVEPDEMTSVGLPIPGVSVRIVDDSGSALPAGETGLVEVTSRFAASAYDREVPHSESYFRAEGFFPGDTGRLSRRGTLTLCGRRRGFINVNGYKVDPAEVEAVLLQLPGVVDAAVVALDDVCSSEKVKAVLVASPDVSSTIVRAHCARHLAPFKCPKDIVFCSELPKSPLGKLLRKYLMEDSSGQGDRV